MLNWLQVGFLGLNVIYSSIGYLVYNYERIVPAVILRAVKYGAFTYEGRDAKFMKKLDVPKHYYGHFYVFACILNIMTLVYMTLVYFCDVQVNIYYVKFLQALEGSASPGSVLASFATLSLVTLQSLKRCYETQCMQVFAKSSKIYPTHYLAGWLFYFALNAAIVGQAPLFCGDKDRNSIVWTDVRTTIMLIPGIPIFLWAWHEQHQTNAILANLRKDKKSGRIITEEHKIPQGRLFENISSPHRYCEIILYAVFFSILQTKTAFCVFLWVLCNQIQTSVLVHKWYRNTFKNYPKQRYALFKGIL